MHTRKLIKKELRLQKNNLLFFGALVVFVLLVCILGRTPVADIGLSPMGHVRDLLQLMYLLAGAFGLIFLIPAMFGSTVFAEEKRLGTDEWVSGLPVSRRKVFLVKIGVVLFLSALSGGIIAQFYDLIAPDQKIYHLVLRGQWPLFLSLLVAAIAIYLSSFIKDSYRALIFVPFLFLLYLLAILIVDPNKFVFPLKWDSRLPGILSWDTYRWLAFYIPTGILLFFAYRNFNNRYFTVRTGLIQLCLILTVVSLGTVYNISKRYKVLKPATMRVTGIKGIALDPKFQRVEFDPRSDYFSYDLKSWKNQWNRIKEVSFPLNSEVPKPGDEPYIISLNEVDEQKHLLTGIVFPKPPLNSSLSTDPMDFTLDYKSGKITYENLIKNSPRYSAPQMDVRNNSSTSPKAMEWKEITYTQSPDKKILMGYSKDPLPVGFFSIPVSDNLTTATLPDKIAKLFEKDKKFLEIPAIPDNSPMSEYLKSTSDTLSFSVLHSYYKPQPTNRYYRVSPDPYNNRVAYFRETSSFNKKHRIQTRLHHLFFYDFNTEKESYIGSIPGLWYNEAIQSVWMPSGKFVVISSTDELISFNDTPQSEYKLFFSNVQAPKGSSLMVVSQNTLILYKYNSYYFVIDPLDESLRPKLYDDWLPGL